MDLQSLLISRNMFHNVPFISFFFFTTSLVESLSVNSKYSACGPQNCGNGPNISYPFWIPQQQESNCGSPGFNVTCKGNYPTRIFSDDDYIIKDIFYTNNSLLLVKAEFYDGDNECPLPKRNFSIEKTPFNYGPATMNLSFFYNCTVPYENATYAVDCGSNATHHAFAVFHADLLRYRNYSAESCQDYVNAPVETDDLSRLLDINFTGILKKGFVLQWDAVDCRNCRSSGGSCDSDNKKFTCNHDKGLNLGLKIGIGFGAATISALFMCLLFLIYQRRNKKRYAAASFNSRDISLHPSSITDLEKDGNYFGVHIFTYRELEEATNNFDSKKELGDGGLGQFTKANSEMGVLLLLSD
ncbi:unnamed protein product, partial [Ilex paraguariensis]